MLIVTRTGDIVNMDNVFLIEVSERDNVCVVFASSSYLDVVLGEYKTLSEANNVRNRVIAAYTDGEPICRI